MTIKRIRQLADHHGITTRYGDKKVRKDTLLVMLNGVGQDPDGPAFGPIAPKEIAPPEGVSCYLPDSLRSAPGWGVFCQLYELRSNRNWGIGDFDDLTRLAETCGRAGADFLGVNPLHALFTAEPLRCSPFSPSNRRFLNPLYIAPDALGCQRPVEFKGNLVDYEAVAKIKLKALRGAFEEFDGSIEFDAYVADQGEPLRLHALFETISHIYGSGWKAWPKQLHDPHSDEVQKIASSNSHEIRFHSWLQWVASIQLDQAQNAAIASGMRLGLYLDMAVGEAMDGSSTWSDGENFLPNVSFGAPPDLFSEEGQNWELAVPSPSKLRETGFENFKAVMEAQIRNSGVLRIDHVMALWQVFAIPKGCSAKDGTHVRFPFAEMAEALCQKSRENNSVVIGEDLGFVPDGFRATMTQMNLLGYRVVLFEQSEKGFNPADGYPELALACLTTHDMPTLKRWWAGDDIEKRLKYGQISADAAKAQRKHRSWERRKLLEIVGVDAPARKNTMPDALLEAAHRFVASSPCLLAGVRLADLTGPFAPTNIPGVADEYPNWRVRSPELIEKIATNTTFNRVADAMRELRPRP